MYEAFFAVATHLASSLRAPGYWGCDTDSYMDAASERVYFVGGAGPDTVVLVRQDNSLERWLETWLQGKWRDWFPDADAETNTA